jgi:hypothetical protein
MKTSYHTEQVSILTITFISSDFIPPSIVFAFTGAVARAPPQGVRRSNSDPLDLQPKRMYEGFKSNGCTVMYISPKSKVLGAMDDATSTELIACAGIASQQKNSCII